MDLRIGGFFSFVAHYYSEPDVKWHTCESSSFADISGLVVFLRLSTDTLLCILYLLQCEELSFRFMFSFSNVDWLVR